MKFRLLAILILTGILQSNCFAASPLIFSCSFSLPSGEKFQFLGLGYPTYKTSAVFISSNLGDSTTNYPFNGLITEADRGTGVGTDIRQNDLKFYGSVSDAVMNKRPTAIFNIDKASKAGVISFFADRSGEPLFSQLPLTCL